MDESLEPQTPLPFEEIYRAHALRVFRYCLGQVHDLALAEDLTADTFTAALAAYAKRPPEPDVVPLWLFRIARNRIIDHSRRERRRDRINQVFGRASSGAKSVEEIAAVSARLGEVVTIMARMTERDRMVLGLRLAAGLSNQETAEVLGIKPSAATVAYSRALERFRFLSGGETT